jgi:hypothetical protein
MKTPRSEVYKAIDSERIYQDSMYHYTSADGESGDGSRSIDEFSYYIDSYMDQLHAIIVNHSPSCNKLPIMRKVAALAVACMEQHGSPKRIVDPEDEEASLDDLLDALKEDETKAKQATNWKVGKRKR